MRRLVLVLLLLACAAAPASAFAPPSALEPSGALKAVTAWSLHPRIAAFQDETWRWQRLMGVPRTPTEGHSLREMSYSDGLRAVTRWQRRATAARVRAAHPPLLRAWLCIHHYEGSWTDHAAPYYGGLQMDISFQRHYGGWLLQRKGTADNWTPLEQIWVAERARHEVGFTAWPNTARSCGLL